MKVLPKITFPLVLTLLGTELCAQPSLLSADKVPLSTEEAIVLRDRHKALSLLVKSVEAELDSTEARIDTFKAKSLDSKLPEKVRARYGIMTKRLSANIDSLEDKLDTILETLEKMTESLLEYDKNKAKKVSRSSNLRP